jgi:gas vesicle protein
MPEHSQDLLTDIESGRSGSSWWNHVPAMTVAAAVGAGVALLVATERGREASRDVSRKVRDLDLPSRASSLGAAALDGYELVRHGRRQRKSHGALYATLGSLAGAAVAATLAPESTRRARNWASNTLDDFRHNASVRWSEHRAAKRNRATPNTADALRRLEEVSMENGYPAEATEGQETR